MHYNNNNVLGHFYNSILAFKVKALQNLCSYFMLQFFLTTGLGLGLGLEASGLGLGLGLEPSGLGLGLEPSGLDNITGWTIATVCFLEYPLIWLARCSLS